MAKNKKTKKDIPATILVILIPAVGYAMSYLYEFSYCEYFDIPKDLVVVSTTSILLAIIGILSAFGVIFLSFYWFIGIIDSKSILTPLRRSFLRIGLLLICLLGMHLLSPIPKFEWVIAFVVIFFAFFEFVFPLISFRKVEGYSAKLEAQERNESNYPVVHEKLLSTFSVSSKILIWLSLVLICAANLRGSGKAQTQLKFLVLVEEPNFVVLRKYGDYFILGRIDRSSKTVYPEFKFLEFKGADALKIPSFRWENVGPLKNENKSDTEDTEDTETGKA